LRQHHQQPRDRLAKLHGIPITFMYALAQINGKEHLFPHGNGEWKMLVSNYSK